MIESVSDSETELEPLSIQAISASKFKVKLQQLPPDVRQSIVIRLKTTPYRPLVIEEEEGSVAQNGHDALEEHVLEEEAAAQAERREIQQALSTIQPFTDQSLSSGRRGLRKRNFASTHPYLADQAHWLDLASPEYLNDIYEENQDMESMLKFLNQRYLKLKSRYPNEDRYKSKSFFRFLGRTNPNAMNGSSSQQDPNAAEMAQEVPDETPSNDKWKLDGVFSDSSEYESDDPITNIRHKHTFVSDSDNDDLKSNLSDSSLEDLIDINTISLANTREEATYDTQDPEEETIVKVGGRVRKQKTVLRGVLPESAKRLDIWTGKQRTKVNRKQREAERRKGLATKKKSSAPKIRDSDLYKDLIVADDEVDEEPSPAEFINYANQDRDSELQMVKSAGNLFEEKYGSYYSVSESDSESEPEVVEAPEIDLFGYKPSQAGSFDSMSRQPTIDDNYATNQEERTRKTTTRFRDQSEINPDFVRSGTGEGQPSSKKRPTLQKNNGSYKRSKVGVAHRVPARTLPRRKLSDVRRSSKMHSSRTAVSRARGPQQSRLSTHSKGGPGLISNHAFKDDRAAPGQISTDKDREEQKKEEQKRQKNSTHFELPIVSRYKKDPFSFTPVLEADSTRKFIRRPMGHISNRLNMSSDKALSPLIDVDIKQLHTLNTGYTPMNVPTPIIVLFMEQRYAFNMVVKTESRIQSQQLLSKLSKQASGDRFDSVSCDESIEAVQALIKWFLLLQEPPSETEAKSLKSLSRKISRHQFNDKPTLQALCICLGFIFLRLCEREDHTGYTKAAFIEMTGSFWLNLFEEINLAIEAENLAVIERPFQLVWHLLSYDKRFFWTTITTQLPTFPQNGLRSYMEGLFYVANHIDGKSYDWSPFYILYNLSDSVEDSTFFKDYLDICFLLNQRRSWPLEEKLILQLYSTVTKKRFFNFEDEGTAITTMPRVYTFNDIPNTTFFECFMGFLYYYISSLPDIQSNKRLATKLLISSHYQYQNTKKHQSAFANRFNFIILLSQMTSLNQNNQVNSIMGAIVESNNVDIYSLAIKQLRTYCEILNSKEKQLPLDALRMLLERSASLYFQVPGVSKVLAQLTVCLKQCFRLDVFGRPNSQMLLDFFKVIADTQLKSLHDDVAVKVFDLLSAAAKHFVDQKPVLHQKEHELVEKIIANVRSTISHRMGGFPMKTRIRENRLIGLVEQGFQVWISLTSVVDPNWNKIIFQDFPYIGNSYSREMFVLKLFCEMLEFDDLEQHRDIMVETLLKQLGKFHTSKYVATMINSLRRTKSFAVDFRKVHLHRVLTELEVNTNKTQIVMAVLSNVISYPLSNHTKTNMLLMFLGSLNEEYDKHFKSSTYVELCRNLIGYVQSNVGEFVVEHDVYKELANKLDVTPITTNQMRWKSLTQLERVSFLHKEIVSSVMYERDMFSVLDQYTDSEGYHSVYHLISIYMKCIVANQYEYWFVVSSLLDYITHKLDVFRVDIHSREFAKFLLSLRDVTALCYSRWTNRFTTALTNYQLKSICQTYEILKKAFFIYEGYKDQDFVVDIVQRQLLDFTLPSTRKMSDLECQYSSFYPTDVISNKRELLNVVEPRLLKPEFEKYHPEENIGELRLLLDNKVTNETLPLELDF